MKLWNGYLYISTLLFTALFPLYSKYYLLVNSTVYSFISAILKILSTNVLRIEFQWLRASGRRISKTSLPRQWWAGKPPCPPCENCQTPVPDHQHCPGGGGLEREEKLPCIYVTTEIPAVVLWNWTKTALHWPDHIMLICVCSIARTGCYIGQNRPNDTILEY